MNYKPSLSNETQDILDSIRRIVRALRISSRASERDLGLSSAQLFVLQKLGDKKAVSLNELAAKTLTHQSSVSVVVSKLVDEGLVIRKTSKEDARRVEISISAKGATLIKQAPEPIQERLISAIEGLSSSEKKGLLNGLKSVVESSGIGEGPAPLFFEDKES